MAPMIHEIELEKGREFVLPMWWCLSLGACLGGNLTIIGAAANVIVSENAPVFMYAYSFYENNKESKEEQKKIFLEERKKMHCEQYRVMFLEEGDYKLTDN